MTIGDILTGRATWCQVAVELASILFSYALVFWAGYQRGRRVEADTLLKRRL